MGADGIYVGGGVDPQNGAGAAARMSSQTNMMWGEKTIFQLIASRQGREVRSIFNLQKYLNKGYVVPVRIFMPSVNFGVTLILLT